MKFFAFFMSVMIFCQPSFAAEKEVIQFPDEELETETVLPIFPNRVAVKGRLVEFTKKIELGVSGGSSLNEAFYEPLVIGFHGTYHIDEMQGIRFSYLQLDTSVNSNAAKLNDQSIVGVGNDFDVSKAPAPKSVMAVDYEYSAFYGKISLTKQIVYNTSTYFTAGLGMIDFDGSSEMMLNVGLGQKIFFTPKIALNLDLKIQSYQGPDPTSRSLKSSDPDRDASYFDSRSYFNQMLMGGVVVLF